MTDQDQAARRAAEIFDAWLDSGLTSGSITTAIAAELRAKDAEIERLTADNKTVLEMYHERGADIDKRIVEIAKLRADQNDWRKGVELIASALGEQNPRNLSCARLAEVALNHRAENESLRAKLEAMKKKIS